MEKITRPVSGKIFLAIALWKDEFRSVNGQPEWIIIQQLIESGRLKPATAK